MGLVATITWVLAFAIGGYILYMLARGEWDTRWVSNLLSYIIIVLIILPFVPRQVAPLGLLIPNTNALAGVLGFGAALLKITYHVIASLLPLIGENVAGYTIWWVNALADGLIDIVEILYLVLVIYTIAYIGWEYWLVVVLIGLVIALWNPRLGFGIAYVFLALAVIAGIMSPVLSALAGYVAHTQVPKPTNATITFITADRPGVLVITDQGFGYTPTVLITPVPPTRIEGVIWLWLRLNYTISPLQAVSLGFIQAVKVDIQPPIIPITCPGGACGAYYILSGTPLSTTQYNNGTIVITTNQPTSIWLWGGGYYVNNSLVTLTTRVGNETLNATLIGCNYTAKPSLWLRPTDVTYYNGLLAEIPNSTLPNNYPVGYEEVTINVTPGVARLGNRTIPITCVVRLYGVVNNTWAPNTPIGYTPYVAGLISAYESFPGIGNRVTRVLVSIFLLIGVGVGVVIGWDWWYNWLRMAIE